MKKRIIIVALSLSCLLTACGAKDSAGPATTETHMEESTGSQIETSAEETTETVEEAHTTFTDNFAVPTGAAEAFAKEIQAAVETQDLDALSKLAAYPLYVGFVGEGVSVENAEDFVALGAEQVFTEELVESITGADLSKLSPSRAGFSLTKDGAPNIIFGVRDGSLAIVGINY